MKNTKSIPVSVQSLLGKKLNNIYILKFNERDRSPPSQSSIARAWLVGSRSQ